MIFGDSAIKLAFQGEIWRNQRSSRKASGTVAVNTRKPPVTAVMNVTTLCRISRLRLIGIPLKRASNSRPAVMIQEISPIARGRR